MIYRLWLWLTNYKKFTWLASSFESNPKQCCRWLMAVHDGEPNSCHTSRFAARYSGLWWKNTPYQPLCGAVIEDFGGKTRTIDTYLPLWRTQKPYISAIAATAPPFDNTDPKKNRINFQWLDHNSTTDFKMSPSIELCKDAIILTIILHYGLNQLSHQINYL